MPLLGTSTRRGPVSGTRHGFEDAGGGRTGRGRCPHHGRQAVSGLDMTRRLHLSSAGPGYFLLGDAAALLDPASSNGVLRALMSGMLAADLAARVLSGCNERSSEEAYIHWIEALYNHQKNAFHDLYY